MLLPHVIEVPPAPGVIGVAVVIRSVTESDGPAVTSFFAALSAQARYRRFLVSKPTVTAREIAYLVNRNHVTSEALIAIEPRGGVVGFAEYGAWPNATHVADFAVVVADAWQSRGLGVELCRRLIARARANGIVELTATTHVDNLACRKLLAHLGFFSAGTADGLAEFSRGL